MKNVFLVLLMLGLPQMFLSGQDVDDYLDNYLGKNKDGYVQPVTDVLTGIFNTGLITEPRIDSAVFTSRLV
jgi:hypothetical protein